MWNESGSEDARHDLALLDMLSDPAVGDAGLLLLLSLLPEASKELQNSSTANPTLVSKVFGRAGMLLCLQSCSPTVLDSGDARAGQSQSVPDHPGYPWLCSPAGQHRCSLLHGASFV